MVCLTHVDVSTSHHCAILLQLTEDEMRRERTIPSFWYEAMWERHEDLTPTILMGWNVLLDEPSVGTVKNKLLGLAYDLGKWGTATFGSVCKEIKYLKRELDKLRNMPLHVAPNHRERKVNERLLELYHREEMM
jgi:hypothetical protein